MPPRQVALAAAALLTAAAAIVSNSAKGGAKKKTKKKPQARQLPIKPKEVKPPDKEKNKKQKKCAA